MVAGDGPGYTWTAENPLAATEIDKLIGQPNHHRRIDYILIGSAHTHANRATITSAALVGTHPVGGTYLSDHFGVLADLSLS